MHCVWYLNILKELDYNITYINVNVDNKATIYNSKNQSINPKTKHIDIRFHYVRELIKENKIKLYNIKSESNLADRFMKFLNNTLMNKFRNAILHNIYNLKITY